MKSGLEFLKTETLIIIRIFRRMRPTMHCVIIVGVNYEEDVNAEGIGSDDYYPKL